MRFYKDYEAELLRRADKIDGRPVQPAEKDKKRAKAEMVEARFEPPCTFWIPVETKSETNMRDWKARSNRSDKAWRAVSKAFGPCLYTIAMVASHLHQRKANVHCKMTRLGGKMLDRSNLPSALKHVEDAVCFFLGIQDNDPRWCPEWDQCTDEKVGVKIELSVE
jgi:hypothetical protein